MRLGKNPGLMISAAAHAALLVAVLVGFSPTSKVDDAQEAVPIEVVDGHEFNQIMKGEKAASANKPRPRADKLAATAEPKPLPALAEAEKNVPPPPTPLKRQPEPGHDEPKDEPKPERKSAVVPPPPHPAEPLPRAEPKVQPPKPAAPVPPHLPARPMPEESADAVAPRAEPKQKTAAKAEPKPEDVKEAKPLAAPRKPPPGVKPDPLAKLLEQDKPDESLEKTAAKPTPKPKSGADAAQPTQSFDPADITKFLSKDAPQRKASTGEALQQVASLGSPTASAAKMSPSLWGQLDGLLQDQYKRCWTFIGLGGQRKYVPEIRVQYDQDGSLTSPPELLNPPSDPNLRALAESALRAVRRCDPLRIPARYQPYYDQWKGRVVRFDPEEMS